MRKRKYFMASLMVMVMCVLAGCQGEDKQGTDIVLKNETSSGVGSGDVAKEDTGEKREEESEISNPGSREHRKRKRRGRKFPGSSAGVTALPLGRGEKG